MKKFYKQQRTEVISFINWGISSFIFDWTETKAKHRQGSSLRPALCAKFIMLGQEPEGPLLPSPLLQSPP